MSMIQKETGTQQLIQKRLTKQEANSVLLFSPNKDKQRIGKRMFISTYFCSFSSTWLILSTILFFSIKNRFCELNVV